MGSQYIHGYDIQESLRLQDQASTLVELLHSDTRYCSGSRVLEVGCGVGAQTSALADNSPGALITAVDISGKSLKEAQKRSRAAGIKNVKFLQSDIFHLPFHPESFDHIFICFVLEHLANPVSVLSLLKRLLKKGGTLTVIEGDHGSAYFYPQSSYASRVIQCQVELQRRAGGNATIGRELYPILQKAGYQTVQVSPRVVYVDASRPELVSGFINNTFTAMIEGIREQACKTGLIDELSFRKGIDDLYRTAEEDGVFCYTFFKALVKL